MFPFFIPFILRQINSLASEYAKKKEKSNRKLLLFCPSSSDFSILSYTASPRSVPLLIQIFRIYLQI